MNYSDKKELTNDCQYCHCPYKVLKNGDRLMPPLTIFDYWGIMPHYSERIGTIIKCDECPECGRRLND